MIEQTIKNLNAHLRASQAELRLTIKGIVAVTKERDAYKKLYATACKEADKWTSIAIKLRRSAGK